MSPRTSKQFDKIRQEKRKLILDTALELFAENGFHATSISQIAKKAGISKGLSYNYFKSKNEILDEIIKHSFSSIYENFDLNHDGVLTEKEFIFFLRQSFKLVRENLRHWKLYFSLILQPKVSESFKDEYIKIGQPMFKMIYDFIVSMGSTDPDGDLMVISAMIEGAFLYCIVIPEIFPIETMEEKIINAVLRQIKNR
ncbi:MAG: TetR/AcrR family transcriptional regulator [Chlorobi bacterium]|nr:TetR/AcrR family transcriptional regulator [Chlorobiota bacterium]